VERNRRFEILAEGEAERLVALAEAVLATAEVAVVVPPRVGTLMLRLREPVAGEIFNAGEALVTEARVALGTHEGYAMRLGRDPEATLAAAVLDVAVEAGHRLATEIGVLLADLDAAASARETAAWREVAPTRVVFDEMR
jgi:alpha-D-ribose 1-methylphosphonate 5-triphosphate synthase subunit PhnG